MSGITQYCLTIIVQCVFIIVSVYTVDLQSEQASQSYILPDVPESSCQIGYFYKQNCNICKCVEPGVPECGTTVCPGDNEWIQSRYLINSRRNLATSGCDVGTNFMDWCQICNCANSDTTVCSRLGCQQ